MSKRLLVLSDVNSSHTRKWCTSLAQKGFTIGLFSLSKSDEDWYTAVPGIKLYSFFLKDKKIFKRSGLSKLRYLNALPELKKVIEEFKPDIVHAHYASSYGLLGALTGFHPFVISVWGSDVYDFPNKSFLHKKVLKWNLKSSDRIFSTSSSMAEEISKHSGIKVDITPFGINLEEFKPLSVNFFPQGSIVIGTIKSMEEKYGINYLINAFSILKKNNPSLNLKLLLVGGGSRMQELQYLVENLGHEKDVLFTGKVKQEEVPGYHNMLDIYVSLSVDDSESFGVAALEAGACEKPVVVSDVSGFKEVVVNGETGIIVPRKNAAAAADAIQQLLNDKSKAIEMGKKGRQRVVELYDWSKNLASIIDIYNHLS